MNISVRLESGFSSLNTLCQLATDTHYIPDNCKISISAIQSLETPVRYQNIYRCYSQGQSLGAFGLQAVIGRCQMNASGWLHLSKLPKRSDFSTKHIWV